MNATERFLRYATIPTRSDPDSTATPSTDCQFSLARLLADELTALGLTNVRVTDNCFVYAALPATPGLEGQPCLGLIAHMDTAPDYPGEGVKPQLHPNYDGGDIVLSATGAVLSPARFPSLNGLKGKTLITTDGSTLLGADDKAGVAEIMTALERVIASGRAHGPVAVAFTPDEETGLGIAGFDVEGFGAAYAYTVDGGEVGELSYENFNACEATLDFRGVNVHPGSAKDTMVNACLLAMEYNAMLPSAETPRHTEGYEGFFHLQELHGKVEQAKMVYIIRDHSMTRFQERKALFRKAAEEMNRRYGDGTVEAEVEDQYYNMYEVLKDRMEIVALAEEAMRAAGVDNPTHSPIRGGTDGCMLTYKGLLCPNLPSGGHNAHGRFEFAPVESLKTGVRTVKALVSPELLEQVILKKEC
mgnify:CR=1 FL=1